MCVCDGRVGVCRSVVSIKLGAVVPLPLVGSVSASSPGDYSQKYLLWVVLRVTHYTWRPLQQADSESNALGLVPGSSVWDALPPPVAQNVEV